MPSALTATAPLFPEHPDNGGALRPGPLEAGWAPLFMPAYSRHTSETEA